MSIDTVKTPRQVRRKRVERGIYQSTVTGRYEITYTENGQQKWETVSGGLRDARARRAKVVVAHSRGERVAPSSYTVAEVAELWLEAQASRLRPRTMADGSHCGARPSQEFPQPTRLFRQTLLATRRWSSASSERFLAGHARAQCHGPISTRTRRKSRRALDYEALLS
jgi:hypothetical protein